ncbi:hypothetical protein DPMN_116953 [Dreissena polymorpha]|uniref:Uncharacterized protein n=1 Tax=Dreissena polymorpha TaxID=45954 RepID=A0A9D4QU04_DREPO|nr:hypothetical protein DPMN_116953 [Dreissena polymorpha]
MHNSLQNRCCLPEAAGDFSENIDPLVIVQKSRQVFEDYLGTKMPCQKLLQDRNCVLFLVFSCDACVLQIQKICP